MQQLKFVVSRVFNSFEVRVLLVLAALVVAALVGGAPHEYGGG